MVYGWIGDRARSLGVKWKPSVGKVGEWYVESRHFQGCSPHLSQLRTDGLATVSMYWTCRWHAGVMGPVNWCSYVTTWLKPLSPTPRLSWERKNDVTHVDNRCNTHDVTVAATVALQRFYSCGYSRILVQRISNSNLNSNWIFAFKT
jgi:hypothetical protein